MCFNFGVNNTITYGYENKKIEVEGTRQSDETYIDPWA